MRKVIFIAIALIGAGCSDASKISADIQRECTYQDMLQLANAAVEAGDPKTLDEKEKEDALPKLSPACRKAISGEKNAKPIHLPPINSNR